MLLARVIGHIGGHPLRVPRYRPSLLVLLALAAILISLQPFPFRLGLAAGTGTPGATGTAGATTTKTPPAANTPLVGGAATPTIPVPVWNVPTVSIPATSAATSTRAPATATSTSPGATATSQATSSPIPTQEQLPPAHYVVLLVVDAGRPSYFFSTKLPHIDALMHQGVSYDRAFVGEMESSTPGVHVTLGTGTYPKENGFLGFGWAIPNTRKWVDFRTLLADGQIDPVLRSLPIKSVAARLHQFRPHAISIAASGHKDYAAVGLGGGAADYELYGKYFAKHFVPTFIQGHTPPPLTASERKGLRLKAPLPMGSEDRWAFKYATTVARHVRPRLLMINLPETDTYGHWDGPDSGKVFRYLLRNIDRGVGEIENTYRKLGILSKTDFIITADHAMMQSRGARNWKTIQAQINAAGGQVIRADGSGGGIWLGDPAQAKAVSEKLVAAKPAHVMAIFYRSGPGTNYQYIQASPQSWLVDAQAGDALKRLVDTTAGVHGPDLWVLDRENYTVDAKNVYGKWKGTHGGATWKVQHIPLIMSGPDIRKGVHLQFPARSIDIAPTMERLLGLPYVKRDGVILADAFTDPMPGELAAMKPLAAPLGAEVTAMQAQSVADDQAVHWPVNGRPIYICGTPQKPGLACSKAKSRPPTNQ
ncbi:MAG: alkaline phosphatase family protein [Chloroflexota bacterium]